MLYHGLQGYPFKMNIHNFICDNDEKAIAKICFSANDYCCEQGKISPCYLIECMGQVVEKCLCSQGDTTKRYLVGIDKFSINLDFKNYISENLTVVAEKDIKIGKMSKYSAEIFCDDIKVCNCLITHCEK